MRRTRSERIRLGVVFVAIFVFFALVAARLAHLQIFLGPRYSRIVERQSSGRVQIPAERGIIYDRHGTVVARNVIRHALYAYPRTRRELKEVAEYLDARFGYKPGTARRKFKLDVRRFRYIRRRVSDSLARRFMAEVPPGLYLRDETAREYPYGTVGRQVLGFTSIDNQGLSGFEFAFDSLLSGSPGYADIRRDAFRNTYRVKEQALVKPVKGTSVVLTIDWRLQQIVEQELRQAVEKYNAVSGKAVFLDCHTGDILAIAHYDPDEPDPEHPAKLRAVTDQFEPESVLKPLAMAAMLDARIVDFTDTVFCENGRWRVGRRILHDDKELGWLTVRDILAFSSNIGMGKLAVLLGGDSLVAAYERFGLGRELDCGLPGEVSGAIARPAVWSDYTISALAMGHSIAVNALQVANAFAAIANGGRLLRPHILLGEVGDDGTLVNVRRSDPLGRVMEPRSVDSLQAFLRAVVEYGTGTPANSPVVSIAGKTGTAEVVNPNGRGYLKNRFTASFAGFFPFEAPLVAGIVVLDQPKPIHYGGYTAGPTFRRIAERYAMTEPDIFTDPSRDLVARRNDDPPVTVSPNLIGMGVAEARQVVTARRLDLRASVDSGTVVWQYPPPDRRLFAGDAIVVLVQWPDSTLTMADLRGLPVRRAAALLAHAGVQLNIRGRGRVVRQSIPPGRPLAENMDCTLVCRPG